MIPMRTEININAPPEKIWAVLVDFDHHPQWNPFVVSICGRLEEGETLTMCLNRPRPFGMRFRPRITRVKEHNTFRFLGQFIIPALFSGEHIFELVINDDASTRFIHREEFHGLIPRLLGRILDTVTRGNYERFNRAIKQQIESGNQASPTS